MNSPPPLSIDQLKEARAICDEICERLETDDEYNYDLNERRGKAGSFLDEVWDHSMAMLRRAGWDPQRTGAMIRVRRR
jgi:hypothetical protein